MSDKIADALPPAIEIVDVPYGGASADGATLSLTLTTKVGEPLPVVMARPIAEKLIFAAQSLLSKPGQGAASSILAMVTEPASISAKAAPDGSHAVLVFEASTAPRAKIRLEPGELKRVRRELKRIEEHLRQLRMKH